MDNYEDVINLPHHQSAKRQHMSLHDRAAQFAPFAALTGYEQEIAETARLTDKRIELDENEISILNEKLQYLADNLDKQIEVSITHFVPDRLKDGGSYAVSIGKIKKFDDNDKNVIFTNGEIIPIIEIFEVEMTK